MDGPSYPAMTSREKSETNALTDSSCKSLISQCSFPTFNDICYIPYRHYYGCLIALNLLGSRNRYRMKVRHGKHYLHNKSLNLY